MNPPEARRRGRALLILAALALVAGAALYLRSWRLDYDKIHPDDPKQIQAAREFIKGDYLYGLTRRNKYIKGYPYFAMHLLEWAYEGYEQVLAHVVPSRPAPRTVLADEEFDIFLRRFGLLLNCCYELVALGLVFLVGRRLFDPWVGLAAAAVFAVSSLRIQTAHMIGADLPQCLFVFGAFFFCARLRDRERLGDWLGAGACAGLAAAAKYSGVLSLLAPALVFLELLRREGWRSAAVPRRWVGPLAVLASFAVAFVLATPSVLLAPSDGVAAIRSALHASANFRIPEEYAGRRFAFVLDTWYSHLNNFLRFFEPLPGWLTLASLAVFVARRRLRASLVWIYPLTLFPIGAYGFPVAVPYHYLGILSPLVWVIGFAAVEALRAVRWRGLRIATAAALALWAFAAALSDASIFALPTATELAGRWLSDCAVPERFELISPQDARKQNFPRIFGIDLEDFSAAAQVEKSREAAEMAAVVANFELEKRTPTLNHIRNRPHRIRWGDGRARDAELFPPPRRAAEDPEALVFPRNLTLSRTPALMSLFPAQTLVRRIRREEGASSWLLYARYPLRAEGRDKARLRLQRRGRWRTLWVEKGGERLVELDLSRGDLLFNGQFATVRLRSSEPVLVWLVSPLERGWFLLMMERWRELEEWERQQSGWKAEARLAIARRHLGAPAGQPSALAAVEAALPGFHGGDPSERFRIWTSGVDLGIYADPRPALELKGNETALPAGGSLTGASERLVPGFYRATWEISGSGGDGELALRVTADAGRREVAALTLPLPAGRRTLSVPLRISASSPGLDLEFSVVNAGSAPVRVEAISVENDPERQLRWWLEELRRALGDRDPS